MPTVLFAAPIAALLAWLALRSRRPKRERAGVLEGVDGAFAPGATGRLAADAGEEEEPFKRRFLPEMTGGEVGGVYGPHTQEQAPSAPSDGYSEPPAATQTVTMQGTPDFGPWTPYVPVATWEANIATYPTSPFGYTDPTQGVIPYGGVTSAKPAPIPMGLIKAE